MRGMLLAGLVLLGGCGPGEFFSPERRAERRVAQQQERWAAMDAEAAFNASPEGKATLGCRFRTNAAMQSWRARSILDLEGTARSNQLMDQCLAYWRQTGQLP